MALKIYCPPGDYEAMRDRHFWSLWIKHNITPTGYWLHFSMKNAEELLLIFRDPAHEIIFKLKAPQYITFELVEKIIEINNI